MKGGTDTELATPMTEIIDATDLHLMQSRSGACG